jgi:hypothetical protein
MLSRHSFSVTSLCQISPWWVHPCLFVDLKIYSHDENCCSLITLPHDLLAPCNLCLLVVLENQPPVHFWLVDEQSELQSCLEFCQFTQALLARWKMPLPIGIGPRLQLWHSSQRMSYYSSYATKRKDIMLGVLLPWLVTFEPQACCFSKT